MTCTYDHRLRRIGHPVRSAIHKPQIGRLVVGWVTTSEYLLLYVFFWLFFLADVLHFVSKLVYGSEIYPYSSIFLLFLKVSTGDWNFSLEEYRSQCDMAGR